ncbi:hypothetical protein OPT61_g9075 [Boeremia exigua]|uniref:Uncharacterized protein n=1 Tax=Boeremia exigua TaxID=749465 RepID=A0ACC2HVL3_9PLEO|nr:hypothetical protein OPT61_g9075 [Boeremia exigua]
MPPKAATGDKAGKTYSADVVAAVLYATGTTSLSMKNYELMSSLDGVKTASAFQHDFRAVIAKAKELKARVESGETFQSGQATNKRGMCVCALTFTVSLLSFIFSFTTPIPGSNKVLQPSKLPIFSDVPLHFTLLYSFSAA